MGRRKTVGVDLPPFVWRRKRGASARYYFNAGDGRVIPMGARVEMTEYARLVRSERGTPASEAERGLLAGLCRAAKTRAAQRGIAFDLTTEFLMALYRAGKGRCALTGIAFDMTIERTTRVRPFGVSIDRIDGRGPYTKDNVRLILTALNIAINEFGWETYLLIARRATRKLRKDAKHADTVTSEDAAVTA
jgi:hypothetical protein